MANAFVSQMAAEAESLREAKAQLEADLAAGRPLQESREKLEKVNAGYKAASVTVRKHTPKPKAQAKASATASK